MNMKELFIKWHAEWKICRLMQKQRQLEEDILLAKDDFNKATKKLKDLQSEYSKSYGRPFELPR